MNTYSSISLFDFFKTYFHLLNRKINFPPECSYLFDLLSNEMPVLSIVSVLMFSLLCKQPGCDNVIVVVFCVITVVVRNEIFNFLNTFVATTIEITTTIEIIISIVVENKFQTYLHIATTIEITTTIEIIISIGLRMHFKLNNTLQKTI